MVQAVGGALLMANSAAIIADAFPSDQLGFALGINMVAAIVGSFLGIIVGGVLSELAGAGSSSPTSRSAPSAPSGPTSS